jgi:hypothetical protein
MKALPDAQDRRNRTDRLLVLVGTAFAAVALLLTAAVLVATIPLGALGGSTVAPLVFTVVLAAVAAAASRLGRRRTGARTPPGRD